MELFQLNTPSVRLQIPFRLTAQLKLQNLTLHQLAVAILPSHPENFILPEKPITLEACLELVVKLQVRYYQEASLNNFLHNQLLIAAYDLDSDVEEPVFSQTEAVSVMFELSKGITFLQKIDHNPSVKVTRLLDSAPLSHEQRQNIEAIAEEQGKVKRIVFFGNTAIVDYQKLNDFTPEVRLKDKSYFAIRKTPLVVCQLPRKLVNPKHVVQSSKGQQKVRQVSTPVKQDKRRLHLTFAQTPRRKESEDYSTIALKYKKDTKRREDRLYNALLRRSQITPPHKIYIEDHALELEVLMPGEEQECLVVLTVSDLVVIPSGNQKAVFSRNLKLDRSQRVLMKRLKERVMVGCGSVVFLATISIRERNIALRSFNVDRKVIEDLQYYEQMNAIAIVGKNISKLSIFGKQTLRLNLKLYRADSLQYIDKYDIGNNGGTITSCNYCEAHEALLLTLQACDPQQLLCVKISQAGLQTLFRVDLLELGIGEVIQSIKYLGGLVILERIRGQIYLKELQVEADRSVKISILNKNSEVQVERVKAHGARIFGVSKGVVSVMVRGLWMRIANGSAVAGKSDGAWIANGQQVCFVEFPDQQDLQF